jgi:hypothetical protein
VHRWTLASINQGFGSHAEKDVLHKNMFFNEGLRFRAACLYAGFFFKMKYL